MATDPSAPNVNPNPIFGTPHDATQGINELVYSADLSHGGNYSVLANLTNQAGDAGAALLPGYTANNFGAA